jgi:hypothetical protein
VKVEILGEAERDLVEGFRFYEAQAKAAAGMPLTVATREIEVSA